MKIEPFEDIEALQLARESKLIANQDTIPITSEEIKAANREPNNLSSCNLSIIYLLSACALVAKLLQINQIKARKQIADDYTGSH